MFLFAFQQNMFEAYWAYSGWEFAKASFQVYMVASVWYIKEILVCGSFKCCLTC